MTTKSKPIDNAILSVRTERSVPVKTFEPDQSALAEVLSKELILQLTDRQLVPVFTTDISRQRSIVTTLDSIVEVAIDRVKLVCGEKVEEFGEVELELKEGSPAGILELARQLILAFPLRPSLRSKSSRGFDLAAGATPRIVCPPKTRFDGNETVEEVLRTILSSTICHLLQNQPAAENELNVEGLHQYRVALRRLMSVLALMRQLVPSPSLDHLCSDARKLMHDLANARDWDVLIHETLPVVSEACATVGGFAVLERVASNMQHAARREAHLAIVHSNTARFQISISLWLDQLSWRKEPAVRALMDMPARDFARNTLEKFHRRVIKRGRHAGKLTPEKRHRLRIAVKKLRYAAGFFVPLFREDKAIRRYTKTLWELQDRLGVFNDAAVASRLIQSIDTRRMTATGHRAAGAAVGWQICRLNCQAGPLNKAWRSFRDLDFPL